MAYISEDEIKEIQNRANIVDIISEYIPLNKSGGDYVGVCPFHDDHSPSMHVSTKLNIFKCFVCNTGGNVFTFVQKFENISYPEAVKKVAEKSGIAFNHNIDTHSTSKFKKEFDLMDLSLKFYQNNLASETGIKAKEYLLSRGIDDSIIKEFKLGLSLDGNHLKELYESKNEDLDKAYEIGLLNKSGIDYYDMFTERIMIPIIDMQGNLAGYTARAYLRDEKSKYINSKETNIYHKSNILFNYYNAKDYARNEKEIIIVEGNMDAISMSVAGIKNVIALMGVVISKNQIEALKKLNSRVVLMLDSDNAGSIATKNVGDELYDAGLDLYVVRLSGAKDPDEYIRKYGKDALLDNIKHASKYLDFKIESLKENKDLSNTEDRIEYIKLVIDNLHSADELEREIVIGKICKDYNINPEEIKKRLAPVEKKEPPKVINKPIIKEKRSRYDLAVSELIYAMLLNKDYYGIYMNKLGYLREKVERDTVHFIGSYINKYNDISISGIIDYVVNEPEVYDFINKVMCSNMKETVEETEFYGILDTVSKAIDEEEIKEVQIAIKNEQDIAKKIELIQKLTELKKGCGNNEGN